MTAPLKGYTILDLTHVLAGPFCTMTLSDLGADVIKVEPPKTGDDTRAFPPFKDGKSAYFAAINHSKKSIALNLKEDGDRQIFEKLLARADVVVENYRPGVMERLGYGWDDLHAAFPRLVYGAVSGFGHTGPDAKRPAYDMVVQARGGVMSITGEKDREPARVGASIGDIVAGMYLTQGILAALMDRDRTGKGRKIDVAMLDSILAILEHAVALTTTTGKAPGPSGARHPSITPFETFHAADGLFVIAAGNDKLFEKLCICLNLPLSDDERFATNPARCENARLLKRLIEAVTLDNTCAFWIAKLTAAGIPTGPIQTIDQVLKDPQILARNMVVDVMDKNGRQAYKAAGNPIKMTDAPDPTSRAPAPDLDGNRGEILRWLEQG
ncbi:CoA transferase [Sagittula sp. NFXS13]|uniref:CaiB/BaiF CoA transferase family protein n=1 Tax=Sagittula sp. NFXS13 TaxID=2819095 RepID=UPI0032DFBABF